MIGINVANSADAQINVQIVQNTKIMKNFLLKNNDATDFDLYDYQGNGYLVLIFFRGAWCGHCKKQLVELNEHLEQFNNLNAKLLAISSDSAFKSSLLKTFLRVRFPIISDARLELIEYFNFKTVHNNQIVSKPAILVFSPEHEKVIEFVSDNYDERVDTKSLIERIKRLSELNLIR